MILAIALLIGLVALVQWRAQARETAAQAAYPPEGRIISVEGVPVHMFVAGQGPDLILLHGASGNLRDFTLGLVDQLAKDYRVIALDRPGLGWTGRAKGFGGAWRTAAESPYDQAALLQKAVSQIGVSQPIVAGHSFGSAVALAWALSAPKDTAALVLIGGVTNPWPGGLGPLYTINSSAIGGALVIPTLTAFTPKGIVEQSLTDIFAPQSPPQPYLDHIGAGLTLRRSSMRANSQQVNGLRPHIVEMHQHYKNLTLPIEIIHGTADTIVPVAVHGRQFIKSVPTAVLTELEGVGHMPQHSHSADVIAAIHRAATRASLR